MISAGKVYNKLRSSTDFLILFSVDVFTLIIVYFLALFLRLSVLPELYAGFVPAVPFKSAIDIIWIFIVWLIFFYYEGLYSRMFSYWDEIIAHWKVAFFSTLCIFTIVSLGRLSEQVSRTVIVLMGVNAVVLFPVIRMGAKTFLRKIGMLRRSVLILGAGETGKRIARAIKMEPNYGYDIVGYLDDDPEKIGTKVDGIEVHNEIDSVEEYLRKWNIRDVVIAMPGAPKDRINDLTNRLQHVVDNLIFVPDVFGIAVMGTNLLHFFQEQAFALVLKNNLDNPVNMVVKKVFDYTAALAFSVLLAIPACIIALLIRATSKGPAIYRQERIGKGGKLFVCYKFRTMYLDAEKRLKVLLESDPAVRAEWQNYWKLKDDPRVTPMGKFLRDTSLDELPQFFNILRGDMSFVGPRPYLPRESEFLKDYSTTILRVAPGITGLWQVSGRSDTGYKYRLALDSWYVRNWNIWLDIVIALKTVAVVVTKQGAR